MLAYSRLTKVQLKDFINDLLNQTTGGVPLSQTQKKELFNTFQQEWFGRVHANAQGTFNRLNRNDDVQDLSLTEKQMLFVFGVWLVQHKDFHLRASDILFKNGVALR